MHFKLQSWSFSEILKNIFVAPINIHPYGKILEVPLSLARASKICYKQTAYYIIGSQTWSAIHFDLIKNNFKQLQYQLN